jgi:bifunctional ADP-heptose synthase (sugar kinase/adenylyltransferase)
MEERIKGKILLLDELVDKVNELRKSRKTVVQSHGVYDLIHPGIIKHLNSAKKQGDVLVVTIIKDRDVRRGSGRPVFTEGLRAENVASLEYVDYVAIVDDSIPYECLKRIRPDVFAKGQAYKERDRKIHGDIFKEEREFYFGKSRLHETDGFSFSSSQIINNFLDIYPPETKAFLKDFSTRYSFHDIVEVFNQLKDLKILLVGDGIIDEYHYCVSMGKSAKAHLVVNQYTTHEVFAGGAFAIANHLGAFCDDIHLVTLLGAEKTRESFISKNLRPNVSTKFFYREKGPTVTKRRYINEYLNQKLFEIHFIDDENISRECTSEVTEYLEQTIPEYDLVLVSDFGHGFISEKIIRRIESLSKKYAVNTQTNAANRGFNLITRYRDPFYVCLDESECRLAAQERHKDVEDIVVNIKGAINADNMIVTLGKKGSIGVNNQNKINRTPIFSSKVIDTIGAGDAFFAYTAPCFALAFSLDIVSFVGNAVGAIAVQIPGNKKSVEKHELLEFIHTILK